MKRRQCTAINILSALFFFLLVSSRSDGAYLKNVPQILYQPDGTILKCYASGDEYHNWLHDADGYTIIQDRQTGYYVYAQKAGETLSSSHVIANSKFLTAPSFLKKNLNISSDAIMAKRARRFALDKKMGIFPAPQTGTINNIVIFIRFSDESEFTTNISVFNGKFNTDATSLQSYFEEVSYNQLTVTTTFYPPPNGNGIVVSFQDSHPRAYFKEYNVATNPIGYQDDTDARNREHTLLRDAVLAVGSQVPGTLNLDMDNDGRADNVVFMVSGTPEGWNDLLWPHRWSLYSYDVRINGDRVYTYNFNLSEGGYSNSGVLCHEFFHSLGAPDLYHYTDDGISPVGAWDIMENTQQPPQSMGAYMKYRYGNWISSIPEITSNGVYTLHPVASSTNNCYRIASPNSLQEYFVIEYRQKTGTFEWGVPASGLLVYRIDTREDGDGNAQGPPDEVYLYRPGGTTSDNGTVGNAYFSSESGRTEISNSTDPSPFLADGSAGGLVITEIGSAGNTIQFRVGEAPAADPSMTVSPESVSLTLQTGQTGTRSINIGNNGEAGSVLTYTLSLADNIEPASFPQPSVSGSIFESDISSYSAGSTFNIVFTVSNNSDDVEWLSDLAVDFPDGVAVNSSTNFIGGSAALTSNGATGNGANISWDDQDGGFGNIRDGETASATVNVTVDGAFSGDLALDWTITGDGFGSVPHTLTGTLTLSQDNSGLQWVTASPLSGSANQGETDVITLSFDASGLSADTYSATLTISHNSGEDVDVPISLTVESSGELETPELTGIDIVNANQAQLTFTAVSGATGYHVYRGTTAGFEADTDGGSNRIGDSVTDQDGVTTGVQWTDTDAVAGNVAENYFYQVTAVGDGQSSLSNVMGIFDFNLVTTATTDFNEIGLPLNISGISKASDLMAAIPNCNSVARWLASQQGYEQYVPSIPPTDFDVSMGNAYYVNVTADGVYTLTGSVVDVSFNLVTTATTDFNEVIIGLDKTGLSKASDLMGDIPNCNSVARWVASLQGYEQYVPGIPPTDFDVQTGHPFYVNVTEDGSWSLSGERSGQILTQTPATGAPHVVWGQFENQPVSHFIARLKHRPDQITETSSGCSLTEDYWIVQCADLPGGWAVGDTLMVQFMDDAGNTVAQTIVQLTEHPADKSESLQPIPLMTLPKTFALEQNYPNPFNGTTQIGFSLPEDVLVRVDVVDIQGRHVSTLVNRNMAAGVHQIEWMGRDETMHMVGSGVYFVMIRAGEFKQSRKMLFVQ